MLYVDLSPDGRTLFLTTNESSPVDAQLYRLSVYGGARVKVTAQDGSHATVLSHDGAWIADVY